MNGAAWQMRLVSGAAALANGISVPRIQQPGLALAGYLPQLHPERVQVLGNSELSYLATLDGAVAEAAVERLFAARIACVVVTNGAAPPAA